MVSNLLVVGELKGKEKMTANSSKEKLWCIKKRNGVSCTQIVYKENKSCCSQINLQPHSKFQMGLDSLTHLK